jgi:hypothetical protein
MALASAVACAKSSAPPSTGVDNSLPGAATPKAAVEGFLSAVRAQDLQAMAGIWGTQKGPARDVVEREQLEKRELIMQCYLTHDKFAILNDVTINPEQHELEVSLTKGAVTRQTKFTAVQGPSQRWYVQTADLEPVRDLCSSPPSGSSR